MKPKKQTKEWNLNRMGEYTAIAVILLLGLNFFGLGISYSKEFQITWFLLAIIWWAIERKGK